MSKIGIIIKREYLTRVRKKSFIVMTFLGPLLFLGFIVAAAYISSNDSKVYKVLLSDRHQLLGHQILLEEDFHDTPEVIFSFRETPLSNEEFKESEYDINIDLHKDMLTDKTIDLYYKTYPSFKAQKHIQTQIEENFEKAQLLKYDVSPETYALFKSRVNLNPVDIEKIGENSMPTEIGFIAGMFLSIFVFMFVVMYGQQIMRGVMEEKTSRIVEVIISSVKPFNLMMGKIIGVAMVGLTQFLMWGALSSMLFFIFGLFFPDIVSNPNEMLQQQMTPEMQESVLAELSGQSDFVAQLYDFIAQINFPFIICMFLFYFMGGYLLYGSLYAAIGAAVEAESDSQQFMLPILMPLILGYIIAVNGISNPESTAIYWGAIIPFTSPVVMMMKVGSMGMGFEPIDWSMILTSMGLLIITFILAVWVAGKIYRAGILFHGKKVGYKDIWKWLRN